MNQSESKTFDSDGNVLTEVVLSPVGSNIPLSSSYSDNGVTSSVTVTDAKNRVTQFDMNESAPPEVVIGAIGGTVTNSAHGNAIVIGDGSGSSL